VGPRLAENIEKHNLGSQNGGTKGSRVLQSMFLGDVSENKISFQTGIFPNRMKVVKVVPLQRW